MVRPLIGDRPAKRGETVLIHAAAGGVETEAAVQIARHLGARVLATASPRSKQALVTALGADAVFNSRDLSFVDAVRNATNGEGVDIVLNSLAGEALVHSVDLLESRSAGFIELGKRDIFANRRSICARCVTTALSLRSIWPPGYGGYPAEADGNSAKFCSSSSAVNCVQLRHTCRR